MASIEARPGKQGVSYRITVSAGYDSQGRKLRHRMCWKPEPGMSPRQTQRQLQRVAVDFERRIEQGYCPDHRQTLGEYARYVLATKQQEGLKRRTLEQYRVLLQRIDPVLGNVRLADLRPQHLNRFYQQLKAPGARAGQGRAVPIAPLDELLRRRGLSRRELAERAGSSKTTVAAACRGETLSLEHAERIAGALGAGVGTLFLPLENGAPLSDKTVMEYHRFLCTVLAQAEREMLVSYNAAARATAPKVTRSRANYFQPQQLQDILLALEQEPLQWQVLVQLLMVTGCRRGEAAALKWENFDFASHTVRIEASLLYTPAHGVFEDTTKTGDSRLLKLPEGTVQLILRYRDSLPPERRTRSYIFRQKDGAPIRPDGITGWLARFARRHALPHINPHAFRHSVASVLISHGTDVVTVSKYLGHATVTTTQNIYSHLIEESRARAAQCISEVMLGETPAPARRRSPPKKQS